MSEISFNSRAYCKIILHAAKYPYCSVNGVLLAKCNDGKSKEIEFVDAVPLFHIALNLTPMAEIALMQVDQRASKNGLVIAGYYVAHENYDENSFPKSYHKMADKIAENYPGACLVVVDNRKLSLDFNDVALNIAQYSDGKYRNCENVCLKPSTALETCAALMSNRSYEELNDFDNHLDNVSLDWMNESLNEKIEAYAN